MKTNWDAVESDLREKWTNDYYGCSRVGIDRCCLWTAIAANTPYDEEGERIALEKKVCSAIPGAARHASDIFQWNDTPERTLEEVLAIVQKLKESDA